jgi:hypothetical protein
VRHAAAPGAASGGARRDRRCAHRSGERDPLLRLFGAAAPRGRRRRSVSGAARIDGWIDAVCLRDLTDALKADHHALAADWQRVRAALERIAAGTSARLSSDDVEALIGRYERHIEREEKELLPMAARLLSDVELARIGRAMRERRGIGAI